MSSPIYYRSGSQCISFVNPNKVLNLDQNLFSFPGTRVPVSMITYHLQMLDSVQFRMYDIIMLSCICMWNLFVDWIYVYKRLSGKVLPASNENSISLASWKYTRLLQIFKKLYVVKQGVMGQRIQNYIWEHEGSTLVTYWLREMIHANTC